MAAAAHMETKRFLVMTDTAGADVNGEDDGDHSPTIGAGGKVGVDIFL